jgi:predicted nucleotidyltransferase
MNRSSAQRNLNSLILIANRLDELCNEVTFVGGCITGLLITDKAAPDVRFTIDVDCIINVVTKQEYHSLSEKLRNKGFKEMSFGNHPICRWDCDGILIDVMPTDKSVLGFSNQWYKDAQNNAVTKNLNDTQIIKVISGPYFLATKLEAFKDRGKQDFLLSHDLEDIIAVIDGRPEIISDISNTENNLKTYLSTEFNKLVNNAQFMQALPGHLNYSSESEERKKIVEQRINAIIELGK